jgi:hypothetical protein
MVITIPFTMATRCVRCKRGLPRQRFPGFYVTISPSRWWVQFKFRICDECFDQIQANAERNPKLKVTGSSS